MAPRRRTVTREAPHRRRQILEDRLHLIKQRHRELILKPREELLHGFLDEDEDPFRSMDESEDLQLLESYDLQAQL